MNKKILKIQEKLNKEENLPSMAYRRNSLIYPLVCQVNNITGCYLSKNYKTICVLLDRSRVFIEDNPIKEYELYYELVEEYFSILLSLDEINKGLDCSNK